MDSSGEELKRLMFCDALGEFLLVVGDHDHCFVVTLAEGVDDVLDELAVGVVEAVEWFIEDEQLGVFDKGSCQEYKALLST